LGLNDEKQEFFRCITLVFENSLNLGEFGLPFTALQMATGSHPVLICIPAVTVINRKIGSFFFAFICKQQQ
jgi:hypothetical protein